MKAKLKCGGAILFVALICSSCAGPGSVALPVAQSHAEQAAAGVATVVKPEVPAADPVAAGPLELTVNDAIIMVLKNNPNVLIQKSAPAVSRTYEAEARSQFDPVLSATVSGNSSDSVQTSPGSAGLSSNTADGVTGSLMADTYLPTGTRLQLGADTDIGKAQGLSPDFAGTRLGLTVSQSLLRGFGTGANLATLRQAQLDTRISQFEFRGYVQAIVALTENAYWDHVLAVRQFDIFTASVKIAEKQLLDTQELIAAGKLARVELAAAQAELALRKESLINAQGRVETSRIMLLKFLSLSGNQWGRVLIVKDPPAFEGRGTDSVEEHLAVGSKFRPDLMQARLQIERSDLDIVRTKNGLLPKLDLFVAFGQTGYADSFSGSLSREQGRGNDRRIGVAAELPLFNRKAGALADRAEFSRDNAELALKNMTQLVEVDIRTAIVEVNRAREQVLATRATARFQEAKFNAETEKFNVGKSTALLVAQTQRDFVQGQVGEIQAVIEYNKALTDLYLKDGSLISRRGLSVP